MKLSDNEAKKTIKTEQVILNWFYSTGTLQVQGPQAAKFKGFLTKLLVPEGRALTGRAVKRAGPSKKV